MGKSKNDIKPGMHFGDWTVKRKTNQTSKAGSTLYLCVCTCSTEKLIDSSSLRRGKSRSCGCSRQRIFKKALLGNKFNLGAPGQTGKTAFLLSYKNNARSRKISWDISDEEAIRIAQCHCTYCGSSPKHFYKTGSNKKRVSKEAYENGFFLANGLDRKNPKLGYEPGNVVAACQRCNEGKMDSSEEEFAMWVERVLRWGRMTGWLYESN